jgi:hypothetical protein
VEPCGHSTTPRQRSNVCSMVDAMQERRRLTRPEVEILRRSVGAVGSLPPDELRRLLDEAALLLEEREKLVELVSELSPPWRDVRGALNQIHQVLGQDVRR